MYTIGYVALRGTRICQYTDRGYPDRTYARLAFRARGLRGLLLRIFLPVAAARAEVKRFSAWYWRYATIEIGPGDPCKRAVTVVTRGGD